MRVRKSATGSVKLIVSPSSLVRSTHLAENQQECLWRHHVTNYSVPVLEFLKHLPGRLGHAWNISAQRQLAEAQTAHSELAQIRTRTAAKLAAVMLTRRKLGLASV